MVAFSMLQGVEGKVDKIVTATSTSSTEKVPRSEKVIDKLLKAVAMELGYGGFALFLQLAQILLEINFETPESGGKDAACTIASFYVTMGVVLVLIMQHWLLGVFRDENVSRSFQTVFRVLLVSFQGVLCFIFLSLGMLAFLNVAEIVTKYNKSQLGPIFYVWCAGIFIYIYICLLSFLVAFLCLNVLREIYTERKCETSSASALASARIKTSSSGANARFNV